MEAQKISADMMMRDSVPGFGSLTSHESQIALEGLDDLFKWASEMVSDGEEPRAKKAREQRMRRQVMETVQHLREQQVVVRSTQENAYLNRRLIATLQQLQEFTEQNSVLKQIMVSQSFALEQVDQLKAEIKRLKSLELDVEAAQVQCRELLNALSKLKIDRDYLDELLRANEKENSRLAEILADLRAELDQFKTRKWWQFWRR